MFRPETLIYGSVDIMGMSLKQETKGLTFEEICPQWSRRIAGYDGTNDEQTNEITRDLMHQNSCFVGEANGFKKGWFDCPDCREFGGYLGPNALCAEFTKASIYKIFNWNDFNRKKEAFVKHWNKEHRKQ